MSPQQLYTLLLFAAVLGLAPGASPLCAQEITTPIASASPRQAAAFIEKYCADCHDDGTREALPVGVCSS